MPTYEYECLSCRHQFEQVQRITDKPLTRCPKCGKRVRRRIGTGGGLLFKGSGFYATDYRSESYKKASRAEKAPATPDTKKESAAPAKKES